MAGSQRRGGYWNYQWELARRAGRETREYIGSNFIIPILGAVAGAGGTIAATWLYLGRPGFAHMNWMEVIGLPLAGAVLGIVFTIPLVAVLFRLSAPHVLHTENVNKIAALEQRLAPSYSVEMFERLWTETTNTFIGWHLRVRPQGASQMFEGKLDLSETQGFVGLPSSAVHVQWLGGPGFPYENITLGTFADALVCFARRTDDDLTPHFRWLTGTGAVQSTHGWTIARNTAVEERPKVRFALIIEAAQAAPAERIEFEYDGDEIRVLSGQKITTTRLQAT
ncbi:MAG TPA: hypothetical protein VNU97_15360 [Rhizomicrobium sp.]|nr:hypothetical protein [Rhizomicrobium sp.]